MPKKKDAYLESKSGQGHYSLIQNGHIVIAQNFKDTGISKMFWDLHSFESQRVCALRLGFLGKLCGFYVFPSDFHKQTSQCGKKMLVYSMYYVYSHHNHILIPHFMQVKWYVGKISSCLHILSLTTEHFQTTSFGKGITIYFCVCVMFTNMEFDLIWSISSFEKQT